MNSGLSLDCQEIVDQLKFPHPVSERRLIETHISWVILTGEFAYKVKKPVDLGFVDYGTLEKRQHFCNRELQLNRRFAPDLYLDVVPIVHDGDGFAVCESRGSTHCDETIEFAVKMRQFSQDAIVACRLNNSELTVDSVEEFGRRLAVFHGKIETINSDNEFVQPQQIVHDAEENYDVLCGSKLGRARCQQLNRLKQFCFEFEQQLHSKFEARLSAGKIRRCHGDLHLKNIVQLDGELTPFDGIEFNEQFQCIDVLSELAFPAMDFIARGRQDLGWRLINSYLEETDEYADLDVLRFYLIHRAMVRAKVAWLNPGNHSPERRAEYSSSGIQSDPFAGPWDKYLLAAEYLAFGMKPRLSVTHGFSGSGKSTAALRVIDAEGGIRIRSDVLRHRIANQWGALDKYSPEMTDSVYESLAAMAAGGLEAGFPVVADASFLKNSRRRSFQSIALESNVEFEIIDCSAPFTELCDRLKNRTGDASEATVAVLNRQIRNHEPLTPEERAYVKKLVRNIDKSMQ